MGDMTNVVRGNEMAKSSSWIIKECWWKGTLKEGMVRQGTAIANKVGKGNLEDNSSTKGNKSAEGNN